VVLTRDGGVEQDEAGLADVVDLVDRMALAG
jgi:hypothetical protein